MAEQASSVISDCDLQYRKLLHDIAQEMSPEDTKNIAFLFGQSLRCCSAHVCDACSARPCGISGNVDVLEAMWKRNVFNEVNMEPLIEQLKVIGRVDLAEKCQTYRERLQEIPQRPRDALLFKPRQRSISTPAASNEDDVEPDFSPITTSSCDSESPPIREDQKHRKPSNRDSGIVSPSNVFHATFDVVNKTTPSYKPHPPGTVHRRHTTGSLPCGGSHMTQTEMINRRMTFDWKICRSDFIGPLFNHKNKMFTKKWTHTSRLNSSKLNVDFSVALYPNGINWDQDSFATLKVLIKKTSRPPPSTAFLRFHITGSDCQAGHVICSRQVECSFALEEFVIPEFLSHEVIKESRAKQFEFKISVEVGYRFLISEWELI